MWAFEPQGRQRLDTSMTSLASCFFPSSCLECFGLRGVTCVISGRASMSELQKCLMGHRFERWWVSKKSEMAKRGAWSCGAWFCSKAPEKWLMQPPTIPSVLLRLHDRDLAWSEEDGLTTMMYPLDRLHCTRNSKKESASVSLIFSNEFRNNSRV